MVGALAKVAFENSVSDAISDNARALLDRAVPMLGEPTEVTFNEYNRTICLHWITTDVPVEVEVSDAEYELYRFVRLERTEISHWSVDQLEEFLIQIRSASRIEQ